jgi:hypothetical protein
MEEINLDLGSNNHKTIELNSSNNKSNQNLNLNSINILKDNIQNKESNIGLDLLINKSKSHTDKNEKIDEFKPSEPVTDSIVSSDIKLNDIGSQSKQNVEIKLENPTSIDVNKSSSSPNNDLDFNLDSLFDDDKKNNLNQNSTTNSNNSNIFSLNNENNNDKNIINTDIKKEKTYEELQKEKAEYIRLLERLEDKGIQSHKKFNMNSDYSEVKSEFDRLSRRRECDQSIKFQRKMLIAIVTAMEFLNTKFDPFDIKLEGWSESVHENVNDYDDVFEELHEKYKEKAQMAPEIKLLLMLGGSGFMFHLTNTMFKSSLPGMGDIMKQNPDLMKQFTQAAASTMGQQMSNNGNSGGGGFGNLMGDIIGNRQRKEMSGPPNINELLNNMNSSNKIDIDMNSNYSESDMENTRNMNINSNSKSINLDI